ncbi:DoxX-like family protein [Arcicella rigui]|uniref:DoxX-like family protein n=1 Tax=Arcicella rigui TaxID=797020 RepID=A0ABU5Q6M3_9BACT|nr:DoxX-like family protein [Arcicella rigui]MEA5138480.1 DoxX-like family protein [Arcicella rigui]
MSKRNIYKLLNYCIAGVWFVNGLFCKVLNLIPRHQQIVASIVSIDYARFLTLAIGLAEIVMAIWILSKISSKLNAWVQIIIVAIMNVLEFFLVPDLLLWGRFNALFALLFITVVYINEFRFNKN